MLLEDLQVVLKVAKFRSITAAARHLDMSGVWLEKVWR
jgi:DNA-binding transcriptional LysR family regulator